VFAPAVVSTFGSRPNRFSPALPFVSVKLKRINGPTSGTKGMNNHRPLQLVSCSLRTSEATDGITIASMSSEGNRPRLVVRTILPTKTNAAIIGKCASSNTQYSFRRARPANTAYFLKAWLAFHCHHDVTLAARHRCSSVRRILSLTEHASPAHSLISASGATGRLFINIFSGRFLFFGLVAARFTTPVESFSVFNFLHWHLHLHSFPRRIHFTLDRASVPKAVQGLA